MPQHWAIVLVAGILLGASLYAQGRQEYPLPRKTFAEFPFHIDGWKGSTGRLEQIYLKALKLDDYLLADYVDDKRSVVNLYIAFYDDQQAGSAAHSPQACIPGGGWLIKDHSVIDVEGTEINGRPLKVNRMLIKKGDYTQVVYYWFQQRGRDVTNEWMVKWYLFWDALTRNRTDGALVRVTALVEPGEDVADTERDLQRFTALVVPVLSDYIPD